MMGRDEALARLARPVLMPNATSFLQVFTAASVWKYGEPHMFSPRLIAAGEAPAGDFHRVNEVGPYCRVEARGARWNLDVMVNDDALALVARRIVTPNDALAFQIIEHRETGLALVVLNHGYIIGDHWIAYIDPRTIPGKPVRS